ncbi:MAG: GerW family sporulation protein, partial [Candidatus Aenigmarchaeota archaeon]|nr:GerW family sporulation protein [Candidatus Aenigmarchaeota archaeon]
TDTVVGKPQVIEGTTLIPVNKISFGFGAGGGEGTGKEKEGSGEGSGTGAGAGVEPVAFIAVDKNGIKVYQLKHKGTIATALEALAQKYPEIMDKSMEVITKIKEKKKEEKKK